MSDSGSISLEALAALAEKLDAKRMKLAQQLEDMERELNAVQTTLDLLKRNELG